MHDNDNKYFLQNRHTSSNFALISSQLPRQVRTVEQSTIWNYYVTRLAGNSCHRKEKACTLATRCLALGPQGGFGEAEEGEDPKSIDPEHPYGRRLNVECCARTSRGADRDDALIFSLQFAQIPLVGRA